MLSRKIPKLKLWSRLGLRSKGGSNTKQHSIRSNSSCYNNNAITTTSFYKAFSIRSREFGKYAVQGIPVLSIFALVGIVSYTIGITSFDRSTDSKQKAYAAESTTSTTASGTSSTSASLIVDNNTFYDNIDAEYGTTNYASHKVTISADNIDGYTLTITGPTNLTAPNGNNATTSDVTKWGYAWGAENATESSLTYNNFTGTTQNLETNTGITNNSVNLTKKLAFAATFTNNASDGHYKGTVGLGLTVTPALVNEWSSGANAGIIYMQDVDQATGGFCKSGIPIDDTITLQDKRGDTSYTIRKLSDGNCWMNQNLRLDIYNRTLTSADSDTAILTNGQWVSSSNTGTSLSGWSTNTYAIQFYKSSSSTYGYYYSWCAATVGKCQQMDTVQASICPKGWTLPTLTMYNNLSNTGSTTITADDGEHAGNVYGGSFFPAAGYISSGGTHTGAETQGKYWNSNGGDASGGTMVGMPFTFSYSRAIGPGSELANVGMPIRCYSKF